MAYDTGLAAVMDIAAAHDMGADGFLHPSLPLRLADGIPLGLGSVLI